MDDKTPVTTDIVVVSFLLQKATDDDKGGFTLLQINKLLYICHGWVLRFRGKPLIDNSDRQIQAWPYGPVVENVYNTLKNFGRIPITFDTFCDHLANSPEINIKMDYELVFPYVLDQLEKEYPKEYPQVYEILNWVYKYYSDYTGGQLVNLTHKRALRGGKLSDGSEFMADTFRIPLSKIITKRKS